MSQPALSLKWMSHTYVLRMRKLRQKLRKLELCIDLFDKRFRTMPSKKRVQNKQDTSTETGEKTPKAQEKSPAKSGANAQQNNSEILQKKLDTLSQALQGDLNSIDPDDALKLVNEWYGLVHETKEPETRQIASGLKELQNLLKHKDVKPQRQ